MCLFCHFDILVFELHAIVTKWNTKYKKKYLVCCLLMVREYSFIFFLFLANFVDGASGDSELSSVWAFGHLMMEGRKGHNSVLLS